MGTCFVIQPFDKGTFDKRFEGVYKPAIEAAGLEAYRVDQDPTADIPIDSIERGIQSAAICLADITKDNPNVWYELGYAFAINTPVIMLCGPERQPLRFPFDIQHRAVIVYQSDAPEDFDDLRQKITERILALLRKRELQEITASTPVAPSAGLTQNEVLVIAEVASEAGLPGERIHSYRAAESTKQAGLTQIGFSLALRGLVAKGLLNVEMESDFNGNDYSALSVSDKGWQWIEQNESLFVLRREKAKHEAGRKATAAKFDDMDDEIPF